MTGEQTQEEIPFSILTFFHSREEFGLLHLLTSNRMTPDAQHTKKYSFTKKTYKKTYKKNL
jgi:hypothetical protein